MKYRYRIVQRGNKYYPQWRWWWYPFWASYVHTPWRITKECNSLEEAEAFLKEVWEEDTKEGIKNVWKVSKNSGTIERN